MYTIRQILGQTLGLTKSGVRWDYLNEAATIIEAAKKNPNSTQAIRDKIAALSVVPQSEIVEQKTARESTRAALEAGLQDIMKSTAEKVATERTEQGNEAQANAVLKFLELKNPQVAREMPYDMKEYLKHTNIASLTRLLSMGNSALTWLKNEFTDEGWLTRKVSIQLQEIGYTADGALGSREAKGLHSFLKFYTSSTPEVQATLDTLGKYAQGGLDSTVALRQAKNVTSKWIEVGKESSYIVSALTDTYEGSRIARKDLSEHLTTYLKKPANVATLAQFLGDTTTPATLMSVASLLQKSPEITAKFYDAVQKGVLFAQTYNASANFDIYSLDNILKGTYASIESRDANESAETKLDKKFTEALSRARLSAATLDKKAGEDLLKQLDALEKNPTAITDVKKEFIRLAHVWVMANVGKGANMIGIGASFATAIDNLTINIGVGTNGVFGVAARYGDTWKIGDTTDSTWRAGAWVSAGFPAFIALDGSLSRTDKIKIFGGGGFHDVSTDQLAVAVSAGFSSVVYSRLDNREDNIREYGLRLESALSRIAFDTTSTDMITKIQSALTTEGLVSTKSTQLTLLAAQLTTAFAKEANPASRLLLLRNIGEHETRKLLGDEVANSVDGKSFSGFSIGIGHMLGVTFPVAGLTWSKVEQSYSDLAAKNAATKTETTTRTIKAPDTTEIVTTPTDTAVAMEIAKDLKLDFDPKMVEFVLASRGATKGFNEFQSILAGNTEGKREDAYTALQTHLDAVIAGKILKQYTPQAKDLKEKLSASMSQNTDMTLLSDINSLSSGTEYSRRLGTKLGTAEYATMVQNKKELTPFLNASKGIAQKAWGSNHFEELYTQEKFAGFTSRTSAPTENFIGMVDYEQTLWKATKFDTMTSGFQLVWVVPADASERLIFVDKLLWEFRQSRPSAYKALLDQVGKSLQAIWSNMSSEDALTSILHGTEIRGTEVDGKPQTITSQWAEVFKALSAVPGATCFNSAAYMNMPTMTVTTVSQSTETTEWRTTTTPETLDVPPASGTRADNYTTDRLTVGASGYKPQEQDGGGGGGGGGTPGGGGGTPGGGETPASSTPITGGQAPSNGASAAPVTTINTTQPVAPTQPVGVKPTERPQATATSGKQG